MTRDYLDERTALAKILLADENEALRLNIEAPELIREVLIDDDVLQRACADPVFFAKLLFGFKPTVYQETLLRSSSKRVVLRWPRQSGKTTILAVLAIWHATANESSTILIVSPSRRQSMILNDSVTELLNRMPRKVRSELITRSLRTVTYFRNGSKIVALPNSINLLRGYHASLIIVDEASFFQNDREVFDYVLTPMLATTAGRMVVSSTPWGRDTVFFRINNDPGWEQHHRTWRDARDAGLYRPEFLADIDKIKQTQPLTYVTEYEADFAEEVDTWLTQDILARACSHTLYYRPFEAQDEGNFFLGVDLAEKVDYTAIAVIKKKRDGDLTLTHIHRFKLGTSLAACIGYLKLLGERLRKVHATYVDTTKHGDFIVNDMIQAGVPHPIGITLTQDTKQEAAQILKTRLVEDRLKIPYDRTLLDELNLEKYQLTKTGKISLSHPSGTHDDRFWALALATFAATREVLAPRPIFA